VHVRSKHASAIPLLYCHSWPSSFIEVQRLVAALTDPPAGGQAFHVVVPSIPGFGFSDASTVVEFGVRETAEVFDALMGRLGYAGYVAHGIGW
jgi:pimeloyl-ACP methyl ester carboxylesterase